MPTLIVPTIRPPPDPPPFPYTTLFRSSRVHRRVVHQDAHVEAADIAVAHRDVLPLVRVDADGLRARARTAPADLEAVHLDAHVVRVHRDARPRGDARAEVLHQAVVARGLDG